jgi:hypothetical protein
MGGGKREQKGEIGRGVEGGGNGRAKRAGERREEGPAQQNWEGS